MEDIGEGYDAMSEEKSMLIGMYYVFAGLVLLLAVLIVLPAWSSKFVDYGLVFRIMFTLVGSILFVSALLLFRSAGKELRDVSGRRGVRREED